jgi:hypothetical protein
VVGDGGAQPAPAKAGGGPDQIAVQTVGEVAAGENAARTIAEGYYAPLWRLEAQLFLSARDLCVVTNTDCATAIRLETGAPNRVKAPK